MERLSIGWKKSAMSNTGNKEARDVEQALRETGIHDVNCSGKLIA
jgi:hypothetical protein